MRFSQFEKQSFPIEFTEEGIFRTSNDEHLKNAPSPIEINESGSKICLSDVHEKNAYSFIWVTDEGIFIFSIKEQL